MELQDIPHKISYREIKYPRIEFTGGTLHFILPPNFRQEEIFRKHKKWIRRKRQFIEQCLRESEKKDLIARSDGEFRGLVLSLIVKISEEMKVRVNQVYFKLMKTKWASLSSKKNIMVNKMARALPEHLIEYIVFHEIAHLKQKRHDERFWAIMERRFRNYQEMERDLAVYWFRLASFNQNRGRVEE
jgi:hypothetical protein